MTRLVTNLKRPEIGSLLIVISILGSIELLVKGGYVGTFILEQPTVIFDQLILELREGEIISEVLITGQRVGMTFAVSLVLAAMISLVLWRWTILRKAYLPLLSAIFGTPIILLYLVFVALFGRGTTAIILISIPLGVIPIVINTIDALNSVDRVMVDIARSFNATRSETVRKVIFPAAAPNIFAGVRLGITYIIISVTAVEFLLVMETGLGGWISDSYYRFDTSSMYVGITFIVIVVVIFIFLLRRMEELIRR